MKPVFWGLDHFSGAATKKKVGKRIGTTEPLRYRTPCGFQPSCGKQSPHLAAAQKTGIPKWLARVSGNLDQSLRFAPAA